MEELGWGFPSSPNDFLLPPGVSSAAETSGHPGHCPLEVWNTLAWASRFSLISRRPPWLLGGGRTRCCRQWNKSVNAELPRVGASFKQVFPTRFSPVPLLEFSHPGMMATVQDASPAKLEARTEITPLLMGPGNRHHRFFCRLVWFGFQTEFF